VNTKLGGRTERETSEKRSILWETIKAQMVVYLNY